MCWHEREPNKKKEGGEGMNVARKFLCLAAQGNIDLTCNYWKGTREEREREGEGGSGRMKQGGEDVESRRQPRSVTVYNMNDTLQRVSGSVAVCDSPLYTTIIVLLCLTCFQMKRIELVFSVCDHRVSRGP